jgi:D-alanine-D-alanine ligase
MYNNKLYSLAASKIIATHNAEKKHILLLAGGMSAEREVSLKSGDGVYKALQELGYRVTYVDAGYDIAEIIKQVSPDIVFNSLHGTFGEDGNIQGILNHLNIPYTHAGLKCSAICMDKFYTESILERAGIIEAIPSRLIHRNEIDEDFLTELQAPYVIKPSNEGSSIGIEIILDDKQFDWYNYEWPYGETLMISDYIKGQEIQVAVLNGKAIDCLEIEVTKRPFYDYVAKYTANMANHIYPARINKEIYHLALSQSEKICKILGCNDLARVEFIYESNNNKLYFLEINTHPGFTNLSIVPEICGYNDISYNDIVELLIKNAYAIKL